MSTDVADLIAALHRVAALPQPAGDMNSDWADRVVTGEAPFGRCPYCRAPRGPLTCLNLCELAAGQARRITDGIHTTLAAMRARVRFTEILAGCTCPTAVLHGYAVERDTHNTGCPTLHSSAPL